MTDRQDARLSPTLWRTCRALANRKRLRILGILIEKGEVSVSAAARAVGVSDKLASAYLRTLGARGLLAVRRESRWVFYRVAADPSVPGVEQLLKALKKAVRRGDSVSSIFRQLTAFTHPRRIRIVAALDMGPVTVDVLARVTGISRFALQRHLAKLVRRGYVGEKHGRWLLSAPPGALPAVLLKLASAEGLAAMTVRQAPLVLRKGRRT